MRPAPARLVVLAAALALAVALALAGCAVPAEPTVRPTVAAPEASVAPAPASAPTPPTVEPTPAPVEPVPDVDGVDGVDAAAPRTALAAVGLLEVKGRAPRTGYDRDRFGPAWADVDRNGCDTRNDVLARDLTSVTFTPGTHDCVVLSGTLADPYSGATIAFVRGQDTSSAVQVDHVVALSDAWQKGAQQWDGPTREAFANDPLNLLAVDGSLNQRKGDGDTATWLPPDKGYRCAYVARQVAVKVRYGVWVTAAERDAMVRVLSGCPDEPLPDGTAPPASTAPPATAPEPAPEAVPGPGADPATPVHYASCAAAREAGAAPVRVGDPGYGTHLDGDRDGIGCE